MLCGRSELDQSSLVLILGRSIRLEDYTKITHGMMRLQDKIWQTY